ncbi:unnamed protein product [Caenorhabditis bovis]|uniref:Uncharacterized protein n=1 Tax=Caenorhabditis bovis TaxID=2654633 RepID=A0A8S1EZD7_9PELO|nr:unnamed protein product [Caenorhabditis bovis]
MSRRHSVVDAYACVEEKIRDTMHQLSSLWDEVDMSDSMRLRRVDTAFKHITHLCDEMLEGEMEMVRNLRASIRENSLKIAKMRTELELETFQKPEDIKDNSIALMRHLQKEVENLEIEFNRRHSEQKMLVEKINMLKTRLDSSFDFDDDIHILFPIERLNYYEREYSDMEEMLRSRYHKVEQLQSEMKQWMSWTNDIKKIVESDDDLRCLLENNIDDEDFVFSEKIVELLQTYHADLLPIYTHWLEDIEFRWTEKREELLDLWEKCMIPEELRYYDAQFEPGRHTEETLQKMEAECDVLKKKYESSKRIFELINRWKTAWNEKLSIDEKRKMPDYYKKVNVLPDNKRERELLAIMPQLEKEIKAANRKYENEHPDDKILIQGKDPNEYINYIKEEHKREQMFELKLKKEEKEKTRMQSPQATPRSQKRTKPYFRTPASTAKMEPAAKRLNFDNLPQCVSPYTSEPLSFITPTRQGPAGPKTSSPKEVSSRTHTPMSRRAITPSSTSSSAKSRPLSRRNL